PLKNKIPGRGDDTILSKDDMNMPNNRQPTNRVKIYRRQRGWSQEELAQRAGISRAAVSAIEIQRLVPSVAAAIALATVLECRVEDLFGSSKSEDLGETWAWPPTQSPCRFWRAQVGSRPLLFPVEATVAGLLHHDGVFQDDRLTWCNDVFPENTLVMASC